MNRIVPALALCLLLAACATRPPHPDAFSFAVYGDTPYSDAEEKQYLAMLERIDGEPLAFVVNVGDFKGPGPCSDELYERRKAQMNRISHPVIYTPGDNEWTDCRFASMGSMNALERLARLRQIFFADRWSLGRKRLETLAQDQCSGEGAPGCPCPAFPENRFWTRAGVRFVTLHYVGSENNTGFDAASDQEARCREEGNRRWLEQAVRASERSETRALVVLMQANPWFSKRKVFAPFLRQLEQASRRLAKPLLLIHGDTHSQRVDMPFTDSLGTPNLYITRLETFGSPFVGWVKVMVDPDDPGVFRFEPKLQAVVPAGK